MSEKTLFCYENGNKNYPQVCLEECKNRMKKAKMTKFMEAELESESELETNIQLGLKSELESCTE